MEDYITNLVLYNLIDIIRVENIWYESTTSNTVRVGAGFYISQGNLV